MFATQLHAFTTALRDEFPEAAGLRIRKATKPDRTVYQLVGRHPKHGQVARQLKARSESEVFQAARELLLQLNTGVKGRVLPSGSLKQYERAALDVLHGKGYRDATERTNVNYLKELCSWLADRSMPVDEVSLRTAVLDLAPENNRRRRSLVESASLLAKVANLKFNTEGLRYKAPLPRRRDAVDDETIFRRLGKPLEAIEDPGAIWLFRMVGLLGIRANSCLSLRIPDLFDDDFPGKGNFQPGLQLPYWDSKRNRAGFATPTVRDYFDKWELWLRPTQLTPYLMPHDQPADNETLFKANRYIGNTVTLLRRKVHKDANESIGYRALRHAATARLLKSGMQPLLVADLMSTSLAQIEDTYADYFRQHAVTEAARLL